MTLTLKLASHLPRKLFSFFYIKNDEECFYFMIKALFVLEILPCLFRLFGYKENRLDQKYYVNYKIYDVTDWTTNN